MMNASFSRRFSPETAFLRTLRHRWLFIAAWAFFTVYCCAILLCLPYSDQGYREPSAPLFLLIPMVVLVAWGLLRLTMWVCALKDNGLFVDKGPDENPRRVFARYLLISLCLNLLVFTSGASFRTPDTQDQWSQVQQFHFNNWHPAAHTLLIWVISRVCNRYAWVVFVQNIAMSLAIATAGWALCRTGLKRSVRDLCVFFMIANPATWTITQILWKDTAFGIAICLAIACAIRVAATGGLWLRSPWRILWFGVALAGASLMRHNGFFLTAPFVILLVPAYPREIKCTAPLAALTLALFYGVTRLLYPALQVDMHPSAGFGVSQSYAEVLGVPMTMMANASVSKKEKLPPDVIAFMEAIATEAEWRQQYQVGSFNSVKFLHTRSWAAALAVTPPKTFLGLWVKTMRAEPNASLKGFLVLTSLIWRPTGDVGLMGDIEFGRPTYQTPWQHDIRFVSALSKRTGLDFILWAPGFFIFLFLLFTLVSIRDSGWRYLFLLLPPLCYDWGTMLLLNGDDLRFFFFNGLIVAPVIACILSLPSPPAPIPAAAPAPAS